MSHCLNPKFSIFYYCLKVCVHIVYIIIINFIIIIFVIITHFLYHLCWNIILNWCTSKKVLKLIDMHACTSGVHNSWCTCIYNIYIDILSYYYTHKLIRRILVLHCACICYVKSSCIYTWFSWVAPVMQSECTKLQVVELL